MLERIGISFDVCPAHTNETPHAGEPPLAFVQRVALEKAAAVSEPSAFVLAADTVVVLDDAILGKPVDDRDARSILTRLAGRSHKVATAYVIAPPNRRPRIERTVESDVTFRTLSFAEVDAYVTTGEPRGKAGAYAIQGCAAAFVERLSGSYSNVVGLPLAEVVQDLAACGAIDWPMCLEKKGRAS